MTAEEVEERVRQCAGCGECIKLGARCELDINQPLTEITCGMAIDIIQHGKESVCNSNITVDK